VLNTRLLRPLTRREGILVGLILLGFVAFGVLVEYRSAFLRRRMGDVGVYLRAAWAVRTGGRSLYTLTDDNGWHYHYPPLFAVLLSPLADPPTRSLTLTSCASVGVGAVPGNGPLQALAALAACPAPLEPDIGPTLPFAISVGIFYALNLVCMALAVHVLASALERASDIPGVAGVTFRQRRWWWLRLLPILLCLPPIGHTLARCQANLVLLLAVCGTIAALMNRRNFQAGLWLAGAVCLKLFPAYLLLVPLLRRDGRFLVGCVVGLAAGLLLIPSLVLGPTATLRCYAEQLEVLVRPALNLGGDDSARAKELLEVTATDNQAYQALLHNALYFGADNKPEAAAPWVRHIHWVIGAFFTVLTVLVIVRRSGTGVLAPVAPAPPLLEPLVMGSLTLIMLQVSPVCHLHYFTLAVPVVMGLLAVSLERDRLDRWAWGLTAFLSLFVTANAVPLVPPFGETLRDLGVASYAILALWGVACGTLLCAREARTRGPEQVTGVAA
jgi:hypothetical protein